VRRERIPIIRRRYTKSSREASYKSSAYDQRIETIRSCSDLVLKRSSFRRNLSRCQIIPSNKTIYFCEKKYISVELAGGGVAVAPKNVTLCQVTISTQLALNDNRDE